MTPKYSYAGFPGKYSRQLSIGLLALMTLLRERPEPQDAFMTIANRAKYGYNRPTSPDPEVALAQAIPDPSIIESMAAFTRKYLFNTKQSLEVTIAAMLAILERDSLADKLQQVYRRHPMRRLVSTFMEGERPPISMRQLFAELRSKYFWAAQKKHAATLENHAYVWVMVHDVYGDNLDSYRGHDTPTISRITRPFYQALGVALERGPKQGAGWVPISHDLPVQAI